MVFENEVSANKAEQDDILDKAIEVIRFMGQNNLAELELSTDSLKMKLKKYSEAPVISQTVNTVEQQPKKHEKHVVKAAKENTENAEYANCSKIVSPIGGTFYAAPSPDSEPFVTVGSNVMNGTLLCYIEAMKLMNEIKSNTDGRVVKILPKNGDPIEKGAVIMYIGG